MTEIKKAATQESNGNHRHKDTKEYLMVLDRDTGFHYMVKAMPPLERVPFGHHVLPNSFTYRQAKRLIRKLNSRPYLTSKYSVL